MEKGSNKQRAICRKIWFPNVVLSSSTKTNFNVESTSYDEGG